MTTSATAATAAANAAITAANAAIAAATATGRAGGDGGDGGPQQEPVTSVDSLRPALRRLREQGKGVYLHCVASQSRTPTVAARVAVLAGHDLDEALAAVVDVLPGAAPQPFLVSALRRLSADDGESTTQEAR